MAKNNRPKQSDISWFTLKGTMSIRRKSIGYSTGEMSYSHSFETHPFYFYHIPYSFNPINTPKRPVLPYS
ncbi:MAG: hypothetical protein KJ638_04110, partial [Chloroflexi bacterium]|nr:hypothetical protein [Chloroflexota bacterium]